MTRAVIELPDSRRGVKDGGGAKLAASEGRSGKLVFGWIGTTCYQVQEETVVINWVQLN